MEINRESRLALAGLELVPESTMSRHASMLPLYSSGRRESVPAVRSRKMSMAMRNAGQRTRSRDVDPTAGMVLSLMGSTDVLSGEPNVLRAVPLAFTAFDGTEVAELEQYRRLVADLDRWSLAQRTRLQITLDTAGTAIL